MINANTLVIMSRIIEHERAISRHSAEIIGISGTIATYQNTIDATKKAIKDEEKEVDRLQVELQAALEANLTSPVAETLKENNTDQIGRDS